MKTFRLQTTTWPAEIRATLRTGRGALIAAVVASALINVLMLTAPIFMLQVYDRVLPSQSVATLVGLLIIAVVLLVVQSIVDVIRSRLLTRAAQLFDHGLRDRIFDIAQRSALLRPTADRMQLSRDLDTVRGFLGGNGLIAFFDLPWAPFYIAICFVFHPLIGIVVALGVIALCAVTFATEITTRTKTKALTGIAAERRATAEMAGRNAGAVRALGMQERMRQLWTAQTDRFLQSQQDVLDLTGGFGSLSRLLRTVLQSGVLAIGAYLVINQQATAGVMLAATILSIRALSPIELAVSNWRNFIAARDSFGRLRDALTETPPATPLTPLPAPRRDISITSVSVAAPQSGAVILHDVSFQLTAGQALAVVGPSGSGKSTLGRALIGAWPLARGAIRIDGATLGQWEPEQLGRHLGYLPQEASLLHGSVAQNITRFSAEPNPEKLIAAAEAADIHQLVLRLPQGYQTEVGEDGTTLSGGQRQRIALARALYEDPFLLVLDEPNSNLDNAGEQALARAIGAARARGGIVIVISHRPTILPAVDHILVLNEGRQQAFGTTEAVLPLLRPREAPTPAKRQRTKASA